MKNDSKGNERKGVAFIYKLLIIVVCLLILYVIWQAQELKHFNITRYEIRSDKLQNEHTWVILSDIHLWRYGKQNEQLIEAIQNANILQ